MRRPPRGAPRPERGAAAVEFAIVAPLLLVILLMVLDFGRMMFVQLSITGAAREAARGLSLAMTDTDVAAVVAGSSTMAAQWGSFGHSTVTTSRCSYVVGTTRPDTAACTTPVTSPPIPSCSAAVSRDVASVVVSTEFRWITPLGLLLSLVNPDDPNAQDTRTRASAAFVSFPLKARAEMLCLV